MGAKAAGAQADAAKSAAQLQADAQEKAIAEQRREFDVTQGNMQPWLTAGTAGVNTLADYLGIGKDKGTAGYGSLLTPWTEQFQAPTDITEQNDPGFKARLKLGADALTNSAAARGGLLTSGTAKNLTNYAQDYASNEYDKVYGRSFNEYANKYNIFKQNQTDIYNRLAGVAGVGQQAASTLGQLGQASASNIGNLYMTGAQQQGQDLLNAATARASGYANWGNQVNNLNNNLLDYTTLALLLSKKS